MELISSNHYRSARGAISRDRSAPWLRLPIPFLKYHLTVLGVAEQARVLCDIGVVCRIETGEDLGLCAKGRTCNAGFRHYRSTTGRQELITKPMAFHALERSQILYGSVGLWLEVWMLSSLFRPCGSPRGPVDRLGPVELIAQASFGNYLVLTNRVTSGGLGLA